VNANKYVNIALEQWFGMGKSRCIARFPCPYSW